MRRGGIWAPATVGLLAVLFVLAALFNGPIEDDIGLLNERLAGIHRWADLPPLLAESYWGPIFNGGLWRPFTLVGLGVQRLCFGEHLWAYRLVTAVLHAVCSLLVYRIGLRLLSSNGDESTASPTVSPPIAPGGPPTAPGMQATAVAMVFAVHPIHAEATLTIYGQADAWATLFALAALFGAMRARTDTIAAGWAGVGLLLSLGFKESAIALPLVAWITLAIVRTRRMLAISIATLATLAVYLSLRWLVLRGDWTPPVSVSGSGVGARLVAVCVAVVTDLRLMVLPWGQTIYYGHLRDRLAAGGGAEMIGLAVLAAGIFRFWPRLAGPGRLSLLLLLTGLLPVSNLVPIGMLVAERALYLPSAFFLLLVASLLPSNLPKRWLAGVTAVLVMIGLGLGWRVAARWQDERSAWETTLADHPRSARAMAEVVRLRLDDPAVATSSEDRQTLRTLLAKSQRINPDSSRWYVAAAKLAAAEGDEATAGQFLQQAARIDRNMSP